MKKEIIILGAGPSGLSAALELHKNKVQSITIEKDSVVGGLSKTLIFKEKNGDVFKTDVGSHRFFTKNQYVLNTISNLMGSKWIKVGRKSEQFIENKFYQYPINIKQTSKNLGLKKSFIFATSFILAFFKYTIFRKKISNFKEYTESKFGLKLSEFNMLNYSEKIWGIPSDQIHYKWAVQRIKGLSFISIIKNALFKKKNKVKSLVESFHYPIDGTGSIYLQMEKEISKGKSKVLKNTVPKKIIHSNNQIESVLLSNNKSFEIKHLISTMPITNFLEVLSPKPPLKIMQAAKRLKWRSQVYLFITIDKNYVSENNWIYFPEKNIPFARISEMKHFSKKMSPENKTSLLVEFFTSPNEEFWNMNKDELFKITIPYLESCGFVKESEIINYYLFKEEKAYPIYDLKFEEELSIIKSYLGKFSNLSLAGRGGRFKYTNQDHSIEMGILAARNLISNNKYDLDKVGSENKYFEEK